MSESQVSQKVRTFKERVNKLIPTAVGFVGVKSAVHKEIGLRSTQTDRKKSRCQAKRFKRHPIKISVIQTVGK
jgi:hypothetical protein